ncbi:hypothetical protein PAXRUDRAFT_21850 [Paxillus rubicundulus Ve08.2h10]|uniref:Uncharacterized protein n=1 Tax=Paxillus rubicundulus Ve08.2h10 TaxID=930991 RepID=A0A0D0BLL6_9AGAM|nr:hypothetical protein PAXRUDRAFT_21850 [Paxillus rubicundulus Ve08.2h10]
MTFYATAHVGEFTMATLTGFNGRAHMRHADVSILHNHQGLEMHSFHLPYTKLAPSSEDVNWAKQHRCSDPYAALKNHLKVNNPPMNAPLFVYCHGKGHCLLTEKKFLETVSSMAKRAGIKPLHGHSICISSTLEYLLHNVPFKTIKVKDSCAIYASPAHHSQNFPLLHNPSLMLNCFL